MQTLYVVVASASGLALGYATAAHFASGARAALQAKLKDESKALKEAEEKLKELKAGDKKSGGKGKGKAESKGNGKDTKKLEKQIADANKELDRLKDAQVATEKAHADAIKKVEAQLEKAKAETEKAVEEAKADAAKANEAGESSAGEAAVSPALSSALKDAGASLDAILGALVEHCGQKGALLGDANGIVIAKAGDADTVENTAAAINTIVSLPQKLDGMLPLGKHFSYQLQDGKNSISGHSFESEGELLAITTVGSEALNAATIDAVVESVTAALS